MVVILSLRVFYCSESEFTKGRIHRQENDVLHALAATQMQKSPQRCCGLFKDLWKTRLKNAQRGRCVLHTIGVSITPAGCQHHGGGRKSFLHRVGADGSFTQYIFVSAVGLLSRVAHGKLLAEWNCAMVARFRTSRQTILCCERSHPQRAAAQEAHDNEGRVDEDDRGGIERVGEGEIRDGKKGKAEFQAAYIIGKQAFFLRLVP